MAGLMETPSIYDNSAYIGEHATVAMATVVLELEDREIMLDSHQPDPTSEAPRKRSVACAANPFPRSVSTDGRFQTQGESFESESSASQTNSAVRYTERPRLCNTDKLYQMHPYGQSAIVKYLVNNEVPEEPGMFEDAAVIPWIMAVGMMVTFALGIAVLANIHENSNHNTYSHGSSGAPAPSPIFANMTSFVCALVCYVSTLCLSR